MPDEDTTTAMDEVDELPEGEEDTSGEGGEEARDSEGGTEGPEGEAGGTTEEGGEDTGKPSLKPGEKEPEGKKGEEKKTDEDLEKRVFTLKVNGEERELTFKELKRAAQRGIPAIDQLQEARQIKASKENFINALTDPRMTFDHLYRLVYEKRGIQGIQELENQILTFGGLIMKDRMEPDEEKRTLRSQARRGEWERQERERLQQELEERQNREEIEAVGVNLERVILHQAGKLGLDLDQDEELTISIATRLHKELEFGEPLTQDDVADIIAIEKSKREEEKGKILELSKLSDEDLEKHPELIDRASRLKLKRLKEKQASPKGSARSSTASPAKGRSAPSVPLDWRELRSAYDQD